MKKNNINELIRKFQQGDKSVFGDIVKQMHQYIFKVSLKFVRSIEDAEDLTQEVFLKLYTALDKFEFRSDLKTYVYKMIENISTSYYKKVDKLNEKLPEIAERQLEERYIELSSTEEEYLSNLENAILGLPEKYKDIIRFRDFEKLSYSEIGDRLNISENAAKLRHFRALQLLKKRLNITDKNLKK